MILNRIFFVSLISCLALLTGCWDRKEMDDLALVLASGVDLTDEGQVEITLQIALPTGIPSSLQSSGKAANPIVVLSAAGKDSIDAFDQLQQQMSRRINLGHRGVIVIGEKYARQGFDRILDTLLRSSESRYNSYIVTTYGTTAKEILNSPYQLELIPAIGINKLQYNDYSLSIQIDKFIDALSSFDKEPVTGAIRVTKHGSKQQGFILDKAAVYRSNKLVGFLSGDELKAFRLLTRKFDGIHLTTQMEPPTKKQKGTISVQMIKAETNIHTELKNGKPEVSIYFKAVAKVLSNDTNMDLSKTINRVEERFSEDCHKAIMGMLSRTQKKFKADIVGIGREFHIQHPYVWKKIKNDWNMRYPEISIQLITDFRIERVGRTQAPAQLQEN
ncbi:spore germination protein KC [Paenibacillus algorifonticola]|uniref:Spore germination protein KC n=1 Tax=Paenibacillus algorifonticola TaxID=684063 RepID=A0A1I2IJZ8_9BACL|nr:Ger(x)C family spore germination protein [Paenibacillus algorifonticola]SFF42659.1 spore germination protein KC [Paenibacillus algorifonticola]